MTIAGLNFPLTTVGGRASLLACRFWVENSTLLKGLSLAGVRSAGTTALPLLLSRSFAMLGLSRDQHLANTTFSTKEGHHSEKFHPSPCGRRKRRKGARTARWLQEGQRKRRNLLRTSLLAAREPRRARSAGSGLTHPLVHVLGVAITPNT
eukprot:839761-Amphidinium_carterae.1